MWKTKKKLSKPMTIIIPWKRLIYDIIPWNKCTIICIFYLFISICYDLIIGVVKGEKHNKINLLYVKINLWRIKFGEVI